MRWFTVARAFQAAAVALEGYSLRDDDLGSDDDVVVMTGGEFARYADDESRDVVVVGFSGDDEEEQQSTGTIEQTRGPIGPLRQRNETGTLGVLIRCKSRGDGDPGDRLEQIVDDLERMLQLDPKLGIAETIMVEVDSYAEPLIDVGDPAYTQLGMVLGYQAYPR